MTSAYLTPYQGTDFTSLCQPREANRNRVSILALTALFLTVEGVAIGEVFYFYPDPAPVIFSSVFGVMFLLLCGFAYYRIVTEAATIPFRQAEV